MPREKTTYPYNDEPRSLCRFGCGRMIYFVETKKVRPMPVDYETKETHFAHCPKYAEYRQKKGIQ